MTWLWTAPRTWLAGEDPAAAVFNQQIRDNLLTLANQPFSAAHLNADTAALAISTWTDITTWTVDANADITHSAGVFTVPSAGRYACYGSISIAVNGTSGVRGLRPVISGTTRRNVNTMSNTTQAASVTFYDEYQIAAGGTLKWQAFQTSAVTLAVRGDAGWQFSGCGIRRIGD
jgi:hypothetical protein